MARADLRAAADVAHRTEQIQSTGWWETLSTPSLLTLENYGEILDNDAITGAIWTTLWISLGATAIPIVVAALAGYAFAWLEFPGRDWIFLGVVALLVVPIQMALIPIFSLYNDLGLFDTILGLVLFHTAFGLPFAIFLLRSFFIGIPSDLIEAARIDGASEIRIFTRVILPSGCPRSRRSRSSSSSGSGTTFWSPSPSARRRSRSRSRSSRSCVSSGRTSS